MIKELIDLVGGLQNALHGIVEGLIWSVCVAGICLGIIALAPR